MLSLYNTQCKSLNEQHYLSCNRKNGSGGVKKTGINPASFPNIKRMWLSSSSIMAQLRRGPGVLQPIKVHIPAAPHSLLHPKKCSCKTNCKGKSSCLNNHTVCSSFCSCGVNVCLNESSIFSDDWDIKHKAYVHYEGSDDQTTSLGDLWSLDTHLIPWEPH